LRGVNIQRLFGSQAGPEKLLKILQNLSSARAYFDGDPVIATKKGVNILDRGSQIHDMAEFQEILDFPPSAQNSTYSGSSTPKKATPQELHGPGSLLRQRAMFRLPHGSLLQPTT